MSEHAAILATTRSLRTTVDGTLVVSFEVAPPDAPKAFAAFGLTGTNVAIAAISKEAAQAATVRASTPNSEAPIKRSEQRGQTRLSFLGLPKAQQAGICCADPLFWQFLMDRDRSARLSVMTENDAADYVRSWCGVQSRSELNTSPMAAKAWDALEAEYYAWKHGRR